MTDLFDRFDVIDVDTHLTEPPDVWTARVPAAMHERVPHIERVEGQDVWMAEGQRLGTPGHYSMAGFDGVIPAKIPNTYADINPAMYDAKARLELLDEQGIHAQVLYPNVGGFGNGYFLKLGDRDLGLHLVRTNAGRPLSEITQRFAEALEVDVTLLPATDDGLRTWVETPAGAFAFQDWFVRRGHRDRADAVRFEGEEAARPAPGVLEAIESASLLAIAPSNPFVSIAPILAVREIRAAFENRRVPAVAVSPLIGGRAVKGPADAMFASLARGTGPGEVADCYTGRIGALVLDEADADEAEAVAERGVRPLVTRTLMSEPDARQALVESVLGLVPAS